MNTREKISAMGIFGIIRAGGMLNAFKKFGLCGEV